MRYYAKVLNKTIQIIPSSQTQIKSDLLTTNAEINVQVSELALDGEILIPLSKLNLLKVPVKSVILYDNKEFDSLTSLVSVIYSSRTYSTTKQDAEKRIRNLVIKSISERKKLYGKHISYRFDFIDASNYDIKY